MPLPTIEEMFRRASEQLDTIDRQLSDVRDWLNSDWSDTRHLTAEEAERRNLIMRQIRAAKQAIQDAKRGDNQ